MCKVTKNKLSNCLKKPLIIVITKLLLEFRKSFLCVTLQF